MPFHGHELQWIVFWVAAVYFGGIAVIFADREPGHPVRNLVRWPTRCIAKFWQLYRRTLPITHQDEVPDQEIPNPTTEELETDLTS